MANRATPATQQENLSPPWLASAFDTNWNSPIIALNDSSLGYVNGIPVDTGVANAYAVTLPFGSPTAYQDGMCVPFIPNNSNTAGSTMTVSPLGAATILDAAGTALTGGEIPAGRTVTLVYRSAAPTGFRIIGNQYVPIVFLVTSSANQTVPCDGASSVCVLYTFNASATATLTLARLRAGVPVTISVNLVSFTSTLIVVATTPAGGAITTAFVVQGLSGLQTSIGGTSQVFIGNGQLTGVTLFMGFTHT